ncbi:MAG: PASTA domain-containing protein [Prevotellaceae bacterium]|nr:PASTA domain-containing protein [Prevotellaceae bacterium]
MKIKTVFSFITSRFLWVNLAIVVVVLLMIGIFILTVLKRNTRHGEQISVPNVVGLSEAAARPILLAQGISYEVIDSVFLRDRKRGEIVEQTPKPDSKVKSGRTIYLTINAFGDKIVVLPNLRNLSVRQVQHTLKALGFAFLVRTEPSEFLDLVLDITDISGQPLNAGARLKDGSMIVLVVGKNVDNEKFTVVPHVVGLDIFDAEKYIRNNQLVVGAIDYDIAPVSDAEKALYIVYRQDPTAGRSIVIGKRVDLYLSKERNKARSQTKSDDDFF